MKKRIRLTEGDLHRIVKESVKRVLKESNNDRIEKAYHGKDSGKVYHVSIENPGPLKHTNGTKELYCGFESWVEGDEENTYVEGGIWIEDGWVVDFDGCGVLPKAVKKALGEMGIQAD